MKYLDEFRNGPQVKALVANIARSATRPWAIMEVCGGQTHSLIRNALDRILPPQIEMIHGPGCPVCVTPIQMIDKALEIAAKPQVIFCSFGDMLRVPGSHQDLLGAKAKGADVRIVYSPLDAIKLAQSNLNRQVVLFAIGFETTAPAVAMAIQIAAQRGLKNFSVLTSHVLVPPAISAIMSSPANRVQAFLAAGHVCSVMGFHQYHPLAAKFRVPIVVTGFEPLDLLEGIRRAVLQLEQGKAEVENAYPRVVTEQGNIHAQQTIQQVFQVVDRSWRGVGHIQASGWQIQERYQEYDAEKRFNVAHIQAQEPAICRAGEVLQGIIKPHECPAFGSTCTPRTPLGATMVSSEGACAAYFNYGRLVQVSGVS